MQKVKRLKSNDDFSGSSVMMYVQKPYSVCDQIDFFGYTYTESK